MNAAALTEAMTLSTYQDVVPTAVSKYAIPMNTKSVSSNTLAIIARRSNFIDSPTFVCDTAFVSCIRNQPSGSFFCRNGALLIGTTSRFDVSSAPSANLCLALPMKPNLGYPVVSIRTCRTCSPGATSSTRCFPDGKRPPKYPSTSTRHDDPTFRIAHGLLNSIDAK